jgi:hypothetical protein
MAMHKLVAVTISIGSPFILWYVLYLVTRYSAINMRRVVPWIRFLRWITWLTTGALFLMNLGLARFPSHYAFLSLGFSSGVGLIDSWAIKRFAPEKMSAAAEGYWPSKPESS